VAAQSCDVLVLGGGAAGCVLADRLSEDGERSVCLVEAGPDYGSAADGRWPDDVLDARQLPVSHDWRYDDGSAWSARVIGGCSAHNACAMTWGAPSDYDWGEGWSAASLEPYRRRAEERMGVVARRPEPSPWHDAVLEAAVDVGHPLLEAPNDEGAGAGYLPLNERHGVRWNAALAYLEEARNRPNLAVLDHALVDRVELRGGRATGARLITGGREATIDAETVVVTAGAYGTPAILLRSGVGPADELARHGIAPAVDLDGVGLNLLNHWSTRVAMAPDARLAPRIAHEHAAGAFVKGASALCEPGIWDLHMLAICWGLRDERGALTGDHVLRITAAVMRTHSTGSVRLRSADPAMPPVIEHGALSDPDGHDLAVLADGLGQARRIAASPVLAAAGASEEAPGPLEGAALEAYVRESLGCYYHPVGTCAIGSVTAGDGSVVGCQGLYVADASLMPSIPRANTHLTVLAAAEKLAHGLL
jgi:choline dehydrogenase